jgi:hypothetical protein
MITPWFIRIGNNGVPGNVGIIAYGAIKPYFIRMSV